ncbi:hypothetical protein Dimus_007898, partial [Dionaea muscipula]
MIDNGLENVMEIIKRQKWEKLFKRREPVHTDAVMEFYAKLTMSHNRKKDAARTKVRGVEIVFDHLKLASILGVPGNNGILVGLNSEEMEVEIVEPNATDDKEELFGIDDVDAYIDNVIEKIVDDIFEDIDDKVDMDLAEELVKDLEDKEVADK